MLSSAPWRSESLLLFATGLLGMMAAASWVLQHFEVGAGSFAQVFVGSIVLHWGVLAGSYALMRWERLTFSAMWGGWRERMGSQLGWALVAAILVLPVTWFLQWVAFQVLASMDVQPQVQPAVSTIQQTVIPWQQWYLLFLAILVAPIAEEILFRGLVYRTARDWLGRQRWRRGARLCWSVALILHRADPSSRAGRQLRTIGKRCWRGLPWTSMLATAIVFAAFHFHLPTFIPLALFGVVLALLFELSGSLLCSVAAHGFYNLANAVMIVLMQRSGS